MYRYFLAVLGLSLYTLQVQAQSGCQNAFYTDIFQDGAVGKIGLVFPYGAQGWTAEITFAFPVNRLTVWDSSGSTCFGKVCQFTSQDWQRNFNPGESTWLGFEIGFKGFDAPAIETLSVNGHVLCQSINDANTIPWTSPRNVKTTTTRVVTTTRSTIGVVTTAKRTPGVATTSKPSSTQRSCQNAFYTHIFQDGAVGKIGLVFPYGAQGWTAEITFAFPVNRLTVWDSSGSTCSGKVCQFTSQDWQRNFHPGESTWLGFEIGFKGFDAPAIEKISVNGHVLCQSANDANIIPRIIPSSVRTTARHTPGVVTTARPIPVTGKKKSGNVQFRDSRFCGYNIYTDVFQDGAIGLLSLPFPEGARGWKAEVTFASPVTRMVVWNSSGTKCNVNVCAFGSASWVRNVNPGQTLQVSYDLGFRGFDAPQVTKIVLNGKTICDLSESSEDNISGPNEYPDDD